MENKDKLLQCAMGHHTYSKKLDADKRVYLCIWCKRYGYNVFFNSITVYSKFDIEGNEIYWRNSYGVEMLQEYVQGHKLVHYKSMDSERWFHEEDWHDKKPGNWEYEQLLLKE